MQTLELVKKVQFISAFTFVYSRRKGTPADRMEGQIDEATKKDRITRLVALQNDISRENSAKAVGETLTILCEDTDPRRGYYMGRDEYGRMAYFPAEENLIGKFTKVRIVRAEGMSLIGEIV